MGRYHGTLHKLIDSACSANAKAQWTQVLNYLESHTVSSDKAALPNFDSPLPPHTAPSVELEVELFDQQGSKRDDFPLKIAVKAAPAEVVAALCHLGPEAARMADNKGRLPIHWACRRSSEDPETDKILRILAKCNPDSLLARDDAGRTPLHWIFWYHAPSRTPSIVEVLCQKHDVDKLQAIAQPQMKNEPLPLPDIPTPSSKHEIPPSAVIVPDARHGCLPLHYAVMQGATKEAMKALISLYPSSISVGDRQGRTALAWYLGAGYLIDSQKHVCGEANDPNATPWWYVKLSVSIIQILVNSKVARLEDDMGRLPLHWATHFYARSTRALTNSSLSIKAFQVLLDNNIGGITIKDCRGQTPLHVLFDTIDDMQEQEYKRRLSNRTLGDNIDLEKGGPVAFNPPKELIDILLKPPGAEQFGFDPAKDDRTSAAYTEDNSGYLPLHLALRVATAPEIIQFLIQSNPTSLVHTSEELLETPLVQAFCAPQTAPFQPYQTFELLMAAYVTSRHGTFMDGRLALKMEDATGTYPVHYACVNEASVETIKLMCEKFARCAVFKNADGDLPVHCLLSKEHLFEPPENGIIRGATLSNPLGLLTDKEVAWQKKVKQSYQEKIKVLLRHSMSREHLKIPSSAHGMTPLHIAVAFDAVPYDMVYRMLNTYPEAARMSTTMEGYTFSPLDFHELHKSESDGEDQWYAIRELLFSFYPLLDSYRRKDELLEACVTLIRNELTGKGSYHLQQIIDSKANDQLGIDLSETLSSIAAPEVDCAHRPRGPQHNKKLKKSTNRPQKSPTKSGKKFAPKLGPNLSIATEKAFEKSIYDADLDGRYVVSPQNSVDEDDDDFFSSEEDYSSGSECSDSEEGTSLEQDSTRGSSWEQGLSSDPSRSITSSFSKERSKSSRARGEKDKKTSSKHIEEKKEEMPKEGSRNEGPQEPFLSDVAKRLWCFFVLFNDPKNAEDNYIKQVEAVLEDLEFEVVERLINLPLPEYAHEYLEPGTSTSGVTLGDVASPCAKALFYSYFFFLGRYEFPTETDGVVLHQNSDRSTILIRATEHIIKTKEYQPGKELAPGIAEESIWASGEIVGEEEAYMASKFMDNKRPVFFKLTRNQEAYDNEVNCHSQLGLFNGEGSSSHIMPLFNNYCAIRQDEPKNRRYKMDIRDERFRILNLFGGESICLSDYPYAMIYPYCDEGSLFDYFCHHGLEGVEEASDVGSQIGNALKELHEKGIVHGNISMQNISMLPASSDVSSSRRMWAVSDFTNACGLLSDSTFMGGIAYNGSSQFETGLMPPEMFVKLSAGEVRIYQSYWDMVEKFYNIKVDRSVVEPCINLETGSTYVLRCHYVPEGGKALDKAIPKLPYQLVPSRESTDVWCFGLLIFALCSGGRPLFATNTKTGNLLDYEGVVSWNKKAAEANVYQYVKDALAEDLLLQILAPFEERVALTMETVLSHPFLTKASKDASVRRIVDQREQEKAYHDRRRQGIMSQMSKGDWLKSRTTTVNCWNFDMLRKMQFSSTEIVRKLVGATNPALSMPCGFILLPYKLSAKNKKTKLAPTTKKDVERAERMGVLLLALSRACYFALKAKDGIEGNKFEQWTASKLIEAIKVPHGDFDTMKKELMKIAATHIEAFRANAMSAVHHLVQRYIMDLRSFFKDAGKAYLYLVDENAGIPLADSACEPFPLEISEMAADEFLTKALPFMHTCALVVRGLSGSVSGLVRLIFEAAFPHIPPSWAHASTGLRHVVDEGMIIREVKMLHETLTFSNSSKSYLGDDLQFVRETCTRLDEREAFADMERIECAGCAMWTTKEGAAEIKEACQAYGFKEALEIQAALEAKLRAQDAQIKKLQKDMERLRFQKDLNLDVPNEPLSTPTKLEGQIDLNELANISNSPITAALKNVHQKPEYSSKPDKEDHSSNVCSSSGDSISTSEVFYDTKGSKSFETLPKPVLSEDKSIDSSNVPGSKSMDSSTTDKSPAEVQASISLD